jgi:CRP/FNR family transcriptional regulator, cyclic AMP receptor protein
MIEVDFLLANGGTYKRIPKDNYVFQEGSDCLYYFQLVEGRVRWVNANESGREFIQSMVEPGQSFGELPLFDDQPYAASALAEVDSVVIRLPKSTFLQLMKDKPELLFKFTRLMAERLRFKFLLLNELACFSPEHRIMALINHFKSLNGSDHGRYRVNLTRQQIADMTGLRVETVIRVIKKLEHSGQLSIDKGKVYC